MLEYSTKASEILETPYGEISSFTISKDENIDMTTVESFGEEWSHYDHKDDEFTKITGDQYFSFVPRELYTGFKKVLDLGCGSGRWSSYLSSKVGFIEAIDPSHAVLVAKRFCKDLDNVRITQASVDNIPFADESFDFIYSLGVLHHIPDTAAALKTAIKKLKPGGHFLVYLYYDFENRPEWYKNLHRLSESIRGFISKRSAGVKKFLCDLIAVFIYMPFVILTKIVKLLPSKTLYRRIPLSYYIDKSFYMIRNDALDRFGTPLEQRFSRAQISEMMKQAGLEDILFSDTEPYWKAFGRKA